MWIPFRHRRHEANYDENGDIVLRGQAAQNENEHISAEWSVTEQPPSPAEIFDIPDELPPRLADDTPAVHLREGLKAVRRCINEDVLEEGLRQYRASFANAGPLIKNVGRETSTILQRTWAFLSQPVWIPGRRGSPREHSRGTLFLLDVVRFGGTFAIIFGFLFITLNYQSFWQIAESRILPLLAPPSLDISAQAADVMAANDTPLSAGNVAGDLVSFLPPVGPPENRLVIPKLGLNVPLVSPPFDALLRGDWQQVEKDIQGSLVEGVVHYPGTAKPGQAGNFFVTGHSSYYPWAPGKYKTVFARLSELDPGDTFSVFDGGDQYRYVVRIKKEVSPSDITVLDQPTDKRISTLMTCTPVGTTLRRLIVVSDEIDPVTGEPMKVGQRAEQPTVKFSADALPI